jgi:hypothetical protein
VTEASLPAGFPLELAGMSTFESCLGLLLDTFERLAAG